MNFHQHILIIVIQINLNQDKIVLEQRLLFIRGVGSLPSFFTGLSQFVLASICFGLAFLTLKRENSDCSNNTKTRTETMCLKTNSLDIGRKLSILTYDKEDLIELIKKGSLPIGEVYEIVILRYHIFSDWHSLLKNHN